MDDRGDEPLLALVELPQGLGLSASLLDRVAEPKEAADPDLKLSPVDWLAQEVVGARPPGRVPDRADRP